MYSRLANLIEFLQSVSEEVEETKNDTAVETRKMISWERHIQTLVLTLLLAAILWGTNTLIDLKTKLEVFDTRLVNVNNVVTSTLAEQSKRIDSVERIINVKTDDRYRARDAAKDFAIRDAQIRSGQERCDRLTNGISDMKRSIAVLSQKLSNTVSASENHTHRKNYYDGDNK